MDKINKVEMGKSAFILIKIRISADACGDGEIRISGDIVVWKKEDLFF